MKVYINKYRYHWVSPYKICEVICFWREIDYDEPWVKGVNKVLEPACTLWMKFLDIVHPKVNYVKIDKWDTWSMDHTLAHIILPMLKQLRDTKHGSAMVDDEDVPEELRASPLPKRKKKKQEGGIQVHSVIVDETDKDEKVHKKWDWVINEMIWAFEQKVVDDDELQFFDHSAYTNDGDMKSWFKDMSEGKSKTKVDWDGLRAHQARKANGFRLFGLYYEGLWD